MNGLRMSLQVLLAAWGLTGVASLARAQDIEPRAYSNAPVGVNFLIAGYAYTRGGLSFDARLPGQREDENVERRPGLRKGARPVGHLGQIRRIRALHLVSGTAEYQGDPVQRTVNGFANPAFRLSWNFFGAPALSLKEFAGREQDLVIGASLRVSAPWSQYDSARLVNIGTNRWSFKPEIGISKTVGPWTLEATAAATIYTDNTDFYGGSSVRRTRSTRRRGTRYTASVAAAGLHSMPRISLAADRP